ncbi:MAG TPA: fibronectin type III domain-containing protein [Solirubrobacteraceae bacterium]|nr:fibronectin type III domain-containing protein [Solirubrobacteraceae bacterium]
MRPGELVQISDAIGAQTPSYLVRRRGANLGVRNPAQLLVAAFDAGGVSVGGSRGRIRIHLTGADSGTMVRGAASVEPTASANRVVYDRGGVREWYANGPLGIEQGFTVERPSGVRPGGTLALRLAVGGDLRPKLMPGGRGVEFTRGGTPVLRYGELAAHDARGVSLESSMRVLGDQILLEVNTRGARYPLSVDPLIQAVPKLVEGTSENIDGGDFGFSVALSEDGNTAVVGGPEYEQSKDTGECNQHEKSNGAAWVFVRSGDAWVQQGPRLSGTKLSDFGDSVAISPDGNTVAVGGPCAPGGGDVWIFNRSGETWSRGIKELSPRAPSEGNFGESIALSSHGEVMFVGEPYFESPRGAVWIYRKSGSEWVPQEHPLVDPEPGPAYFGISVALSETGATAIIGATAVDGFAGAAWVFQRSESEWVQQGGALSGTEEEPFTAGTGYGGAFGSSVAISADGNTALVGGILDHGGAGAAWAFTRSGTSWSQQGPKITATGEVNSGDIGVGGFFGSGLALTSDGNTAIVGGAGDSNFAGAAWIFKRSEGRWIQQPGKLQGGEESEGGGFGNGVAIAADGRTALIGGGSALGGSPPVVGGAWIFALEPPSAVTGGASQVGPSSATLQGMVDPDGNEVTECTIEYGPAGSLAGQAPCSPVSGDGTTPEAVAAQLAGLAPSTTYGFRIRAVTGGGSSTGATVSFTTAAVTPSSPPPPPQLGPSSVVNPPRLVKPHALRYIRAHVYRSFAPATGIFGFFVVGEVPLGGHVALACDGTGCPFTRHQSPPRHAASTCRLPSTSRRGASVHECISLTAFLADRRIRAGDTVTVEIERPGWISKRFTYRLEPKGRLIASGGRCLVADRAPVRC